MLKTLGQVAYEAAALTTDCSQPWAEANQEKWESAANAVYTALSDELPVNWPGPGHVCSKCGAYVPTSRLHVHA